MTSEVRTVQINLAEVPRLFNLDYSTELCARDIIAYVRGRIEENPWTPVILDTKAKPVSPDELEGSAIYWKGFNEDKAKQTYGLSVYTYCVVNVSQLDIKKDDCGLSDIVAEFRGHYNMQTFDILIVGENDGPDGKSMSVLVKLCNYVRAVEREDVVFPTFIVRQNKRLDNGLDIDPYAKDIDGRRHSNTLDAPYLHEVLTKIEKEIDPATTVIQDLDGRRTQTIKLLITYLSLKHNLPPIYVSSFIADYLRFQFYYPRTKLSLYERTAFMRRMPQAIGYISANQGFHCLAAVTGRIYPTPHFVFDLGSHTIVEDAEGFTLDNPMMKFIDYRRMFPSSQYAINTTRTTRTSISTTSQGNDLDTDKRLVDVFTELSDLVTTEPVFLSVKNTVMVELNGKRYILYCPEEFGVQLHMVSEYIGHHITVITEGEFYRLIDAQLEKAILERDRAVSPSRASTALATVWKQWDKRTALQPALPLEVSLFMHLLPLHQNGLSYYDKALRCSADVLPIITSLDSPLRDINPLFTEVSLSSLRRDPQAKYAINCFGTTTTFHAQSPVVPVTYNAFEQRRLL